MKKAILLLLVGVALLSCRENPEREACIREYYEFKIREDSLSRESKRLMELMTYVEDSLNSVGEVWIENDRYWEIFDDERWVVDEIGHCLKMQTLCLENQRLLRKFGDRNYFRIYKKELKKQGKL